MVHSTGGTGTDLVNKYIVYTVRLAMPRAFSHGHLCLQTSFVMRISYLQLHRNESFVRSDVLYVSNSLGGIIR